MLSDEVLEKVAERIVSRIEDGNTYILKHIGNKIDEIGKLSSTEAHELIQTLKYGGDYNKIVKKLSEMTNLGVKDIEEIFEEVAKNDYAFAEQFYKYKNIGYIPYEENVALQSEVKAITNIFKRNYARLLNPKTLGYGLVDRETGEVVFKGLQEAYYDLINEAVMSVEQGKETFDRAMTRRIKEMGGSGLKVIYDSTYVDKDGNVKNYTRRLDSAVRMNIKDGLRELHNETQDIFGEEFGADGVEISVHLNPAPDHELVQGKQFSNEEFDKFQNDLKSKSYDGTIFEPEFEGHDRRSISEYNCYHYTFSIVLGVSEPEYSDEQLKKIIEDNNKGFEFDGKHYTNYEGTQLQRQLETKIREQKDIQIMAKASGQKDLVSESQQKISQLTDKYRELSKTSGLPTKMERMKVSGYKRTNVEKVIDKSKFKEYKVEAPYRDYPKYKKDFDFPSNDYLEEYVKQGGKMFDRMQTDKKYKDKMYDIANKIEELKRPIKNNTVLFSGQDLRNDLSKSDFVISTSIGEQTAYGYSKQYSNKMNRMGVVKIYAEKGTNVISTANVKTDHFRKQGEIIIPISEIKNLIRINDMEYILKRGKK